MKEKMERRAIVSDGVIEGRTLKGYAAIFDSPSLFMGFREFVRKGAFTKTIQESDVRALWQHDNSNIIGRKSAGTLRLEEDDNGLKVEIDLPDSPLGNNALESVKRGDVSQMSFGFRVIKDDWKEGADGIMERELKEVHLYEVSPVTFPAYPDTTISARALGHAINSASGNNDESLFRAFMAHRNGEATDEQKKALKDFADELREQVKTEEKDEPHDKRHLSVDMARLDLETIAQEI